MESFRRSLTAADRAWLGYIAFVTAVVVIFWQRIPWFGLFLADHVLTTGVILGIAFAHHRFGGRFWGFLHSWYSLPFVAIAFRELHYLVPQVNPHDADKALMAIDHFVFGVHPTVWLERLMTPGLTEYLQVVYTSYYFIPVVVVGLYYARRRPDQFDEAMTAVLLGFFLSYAGYFFVPAIGPRFTMEHMHAGPLQGYGLFEILRHSLDTLELEMRDCFPSGHTMVTLIALWYAWKFHRALFCVLAPIVASLVFSTVYLRYHYVVDVVAGVALALIVNLGTPYLAAVLRGNALATAGLATQASSLEAR